MGGHCQRLMNTTIATNWRRHFAGLVAVVMHTHPNWPRNNMRSDAIKRYSTCEQEGPI